MELIGIFTLIISFIFFPKYMFVILAVIMFLRTLLILRKVYTKEEYRDLGKYYNAYRNVTIFWCSIILFLILNVIAFPKYQKFNEYVQENAPANYGYESLIDITYGRAGYIVSVMQVLSYDTASINYGDRVFEIDDSLFVGDKTSHLNDIQKCFNLVIDCVESGMGLEEMKEVVGSAYDFNDVVLSDFIDIIDIICTCVWLLGLCFIEVLSTDSIRFILIFTRERYIKKYCN